MIKYYPRNARRNWWRRSCDFVERYVQNVFYVFQNQRLETTKLLDYSEASKGYKELVLKVEGEGVYGIMKFESGVHRVQRVPETESQG